MKIRLNFHKFAIIMDKKAIKEAKKLKEKSLKNGDIVEKSANKQPQKSPK